ncbi:MAG: hypothetical protein J1E98_00320 [Lachnospiraceae bacterium]|nr:hypothetical protein [Lachnospiraceae bacterium]
MKNELVFGNEPYLLNAYRAEIVKGIAMPEFNVMEAEQFTQIERDFAKQMPFMGSRRVLIVSLEKLVANELLEKYLKDPAPKTDLYIFAEEIDKRISLYKKFPKEGIKQFDKDIGILQKWILGYIKRQNCKITKDAYDEFLMRINYEMEDVNLYHVKSALSRLCTTQDEITADLVRRLVQSNEKEDIFQLICLIDKGKVTELFHQADLIIQNGSQNVIGTLSLLLRSYRILYKVNVCGCSLQDVGVHQRTYIPKMTLEQADAGIDIIQKAVNGIKNGRYAQDFAFRLCLSQLCQLKQK